MPKIELDLELAMDGIWKETKKICRPDICQDCVLFLDEHVGWCAYYHRRANIGIKPEWCKISCITISEDL